MASAPPITTPPTERIRSPLERLRGTIRNYVVRDGLLVIGLFAASWFWISLFLDYGSFRLLAFDWVQEWPRWVRGGLLAGFTCTATLLTVGLIVRRLLVDFRHDALALVLEKKFPDVLGDRLITAVELADPVRADREGYSPALVAQTIREAEERLATVEVESVFDWPRLRRLVRWLVAVLVVPFVTVGIAYTAVRQTSPLTDYMPKFLEVATVWAKRQLFLRDVIWPRQAYLEVLDFPDSGELRIGRDAASPRLRFKARRWLAADAGSPEGWRPMVWSDLRPGLLGAAPPELPTGWLEAGMSGTRGLAAHAATVVATPNLASIPPPVTPPAMVWSLDAVEQALDDAAIRQRLESQHPETYTALRGVFQTLTDRAGDTTARAVYRRLEVPERIEVKSWGEQGGSRMELLRGPGWEYAGTLGDLKESVRFRARGADYFTAVRSIVLVPPPSLQQLKKIEYRPAYLYHRPPLGTPPDGGPSALRGLRQRVEDLVSLNGPTSRISVPAGTDLVLEGHLDKQLTEVRLRLRTKSPEATFAQPSIAEDRLSFRQQFASMTAPLDLDLEFTDSDGVKSNRHVIVEVVRDLPPSVNVTIDGIRRTNQGHYLITPVAQIPIDGKVFDGQPGQLGGLDRIDYVISLTKLEGPAAAATRAEWLTGALLPAIGGQIDAAWVAIASGAETSRIIETNSPRQAERAFPLETFQQRVRLSAGQDLLLPELKKRLEMPPGTIPLIRDFVAQPKLEMLDLRDRLPDLKVIGELEVQPRYRMRLTVSAADNNIETGPSVAVNKEPPFTILVVSETELLVEVARDEEAQHVKAEDAVTRLREVRGKLDTVAGELTASEPANMTTLAQRASEMSEATVKARDIVQEVSSEYARILRELELNRVSGRFIEKVKGEICLPLESILRGEFVAAEEAMERFGKDLEAGRKPDPGPSRAALDRLIARLERVMAAMGEMATLNKLITALQEIEKAQEQAIGAKLRELQRLQREKLIRDLDKMKGIE